MSACRFALSTRQDIINARGHFSLFFSHFFKVSFSGSQGAENFDAKREKGKLNFVEFSIFTEKKKMSAGDWCLLESDPGLFSALIREFGFTGAQVSFCIKLIFGLFSRK